jgi:transposase
MPRTRNPYPTECREHIIALARSGRSVESLAREFEPCAATIHLWLKEAKQDSGDRDDGITSAVREELRRLRRENKVLRQERYSQRPRPSLHRARYPRRGLPVHDRKPGPLSDRSDGPGPGWLTQRLRCLAGSKAEPPSTGRCDPDREDQRIP